MNLHTQTPAMYLILSLFFFHKCYSSLFIVINEDNLINLMVENEICAQMATEANLCAEESLTVRTRNNGGSVWYGSAFSKSPVRLSCCVPSCFTDFRSTLDNFMPLVPVLCQIFQAIRDDTKRFHGDLQCVFEAIFLASLKAFALRQFVVEHFLWEVVIFHADDLTGPTKQWLHHDGVDVGKRSPS